MSDMPSFPRLFELGRIGKVKSKNRIVMLPMGTAYASLQGEVTQKTIDYYGERAKGGAGIITIGNVSVYGSHMPHSTVLDSDVMLMGHYELVEKLHSYGARVVAQLNHPGKQKSAALIRPGEELISSSAIPGGYLGQSYPTPRALNKSELLQWVERFAAAAARAKQVGYDLVELHGAHGYLISQFMSAHMNKRTDDYGGSLENRMRFPLEVLEAARKAVGPDYPVGIRISVEEFVLDGINLEEAAVISQMLEAKGAAFISVSCGGLDTADKMIGVMRHQEGWKQYMWEAIKKAVSVPVIVGGDLKHPEFCEKVLEQKKCDFIGLARPLYADPEWPRKAQEGRTDEICLCISCDECMAGSPARRRGGGARRCSVNAAAGREGEFSVVIPAPAPKRVMVIGGGPAGMEAARIAALRGHRVTLYERYRELGGQLLLAGAPQSKRKVLWLRDYLVSQLKRLGVRVVLDTVVTPRIVAETRPDAVVVATGAQPTKPDVPGIDSKNVVSAWELLLGKARPEKQKVVIIGGNAVGCEVAEHLLEHGNRVTIIKRSPTVAGDMEPNHRLEILDVLNKHDVTILTGLKLAGVTDKGVRVVRLDNGREELVEADLVVIAMGASPVDTLVNSLEGKVPEIYHVGDCNQPRVIMEAIFEGSQAGRQV